MKNTPKQFKIFFDTSALLAGLNSPFGASGFIISLFKLKKIDIIISPEVIEETELVIQRKLPLLKTAFLDFLLSGPTITNKLVGHELRSAYKIINTEDTPILAGAIKARANFLITLDKKFKEEADKRKIKVKIVFPAEFLQQHKQDFL